MIGPAWDGYQPGRSRARRVSAGAAPKTQRVEEVFGQHKDEGKQQGQKPADAQRDLAVIASLGHFFHLLSRKVRNAVWTQKNDDRITSPLVAFLCR